MQVIDLLVIRGGLVITLVEIRWQKGEDVINPSLVVRPRVPGALGRSPAERTECHGPIIAVRFRHRLAGLFGVREWLSVEVHTAGVLVVADAHGVDRMPA